MVDVLNSSPLLQRPGAAEFAGTTPLDAKGVAWHYGEPLGEQRAMDAQPVIIDRSQRRVVAVAGPDAPEFLNNLLSQKLVDAPSGFAASALDLDAQGRILHHADVFYDGTTFYLDLPAAQYETFTAFLRKMVFWSDVTITDTDLAILTLIGPEGATEALASVEEATFSRRVSPWTDHARFDIAVERDRIEEIVDTLVERGAVLGGLMAFTAERVRAGEPELSTDCDEKTIPHEAPRLINRGNHISAVHLEKGCYRGQETVARVENIGRSPRLMVMLQLDGSAPTEPETGATIRVGGRAVGTLGTVVHDADYGPIALARLKRSALNAGTDVDLDIDGVAARIDPDSLPADEGEKAGRKAQQRLRGN